MQNTVPLMMVEQGIPFAAPTAKAAASDAIKKAATLLGVGLELYMKDPDESDASGNGEHLTEAQKLLRERRRQRAA